MNLALQMQANMLLYSARPVTGFDQPSLAHMYLQLSPDQAVPFKVDHLDQQLHDTQTTHRTVFADTNRSNCDCIECSASPCRVISILKA